MRERIQNALGSFCPGFRLAHKAEPRLSVVMPWVEQDFTSEVRVGALVSQAPMWHSAPGMSTQDIIAELPKLSLPELQQVDERIHGLLRRDRETPSKSWGAALLEVAGTAQGLPPDFAHNHDHYLHGAPRP